MDTTPPPIVCRLNADAFADREGAWRSLMADGLIGRERRHDGVRLHFTSAVGDKVRTLVALEAECCDWFHGVVTSDGDTVTVDLIAVGDGPAVLQAMFDAFLRAILDRASKGPTKPTRLSSGSTATTNTR
jgi:hypothetical protein